MPFGHLVHLVFGPCRVSSQLDDVMLRGVIKYPRITERNNHPDSWLLALGSRLFHLLYSTFNYHHARHENSPDFQGRSDPQRGDNPLSAKTSVNGMVQTH